MLFFSLQCNSEPRDQARCYSMLLLLKMLTQQMQAYGFSESGRDKCQLSSMIVAAKIFVLHVYSPVFRKEKFSFTSTLLLENCTESGYFLLLLKAQCWLQTQRKQVPMFNTPT